MIRHIASISIALCLLSLSSCTNMRPRPSPQPEISALATPAPRPSKQITELETEEDEQQYIIEAAATMAKDEGTFQRLREFFEEPNWWEKIKRYFGGPAGGGE